jgi:hypothetical protein
MVFETLHKKLMIEQQETHEKKVVITAGAYLRKIAPMASTKIAFYRLDFKTIMLPQCDVI